MLAWIALECYLRALDLLVIGQVDIELLEIQFYESTGADSGYSSGAEYLEKAHTGFECANFP